MNGSPAQLVAEVAREPSARRRRQILTAAKTSWTPELIQTMYDEVIRQLHVEIPPAERLARAAVWLSSRIRDEASRASSLRALAHIHYRKRKYQASVDLYQQALDIYQQLG